MSIYEIVCLMWSGWCGDIAVCGLWYGCLSYLDACMAIYCIYWWNFVFYMILCTLCFLINDSLKLIYKL